MIFFTNPNSQLKSDKSETLDNPELKLETHNNDVCLKN